MAQRAVLCCRLTNKKIRKVMLTKVGMFLVASRYNGSREVRGKCILIKCGISMLLFFLPFLPLPSFPSAFSFPSFLNDQSLFQAVCHCGRSKRQAGAVQSLRVHIPLFTRLAFLIVPTDRGPEAGYC